MCLRKSLVLLVAGKHLLSCMRELVCLEVIFQRESLVTLVAGKHLLSCMRLLVSLRVALCEKALSHWLQAKIFSPVWESVYYQNRTRWIQGKTRQSSTASTWPTKNWWYVPRDWHQLITTPDQERSRGRAAAHLRGLGWGSRAPPWVETKFWLLC